MHHPLILLVSLAFTGACSATPARSLAPTEPAPTEPAPNASAPQVHSDTPTPSKAGPTGAACGGIAGFGCAAGLYCAFGLEAHCGAADQMGSCKPVPEQCTDEHSAVCGCNDVTYPNACEAARASVSVGATGECAPSAPSAASPAALAAGALCGTRGVQGDCGPELYCKYKTQCGATDAGGTCTQRTAACTKIYRPVCGCDDQTHGNECIAAGAGVSVKHDGECKK